MWRIGWAYEPTRSSRGQTTKYERGDSDPCADDPDSVPIYPLFNLLANLLMRASLPETQRAQRKCMRVQLGRPKFVLRVQCADSLNRP